MFKIFSRRLIIAVPTLFGVSVIAFALIRLVPGDPVMMMLGERGADAAVYEQMQKNLGLDRPVVEQYFYFISNALVGDLGRSIVSNQTVMHEFFSRFPATVELGSLAIFWAVLLGIPMGIFAAIKRKTIIDNLIMGVALLGYSMPIFWWGLMLILLLSVTLGIVPVSGRISPFFDVEPLTGFLLIDTWFSGGGIKAFLSAVHHLLLPSFVLSTIPMAAIARMTRSSLLEVLTEDYIRTAKAKGLKNYTVIVRHGLRNALIPVVTIIGLMVGTILTGAILTETIFSWPGIGRWIVSSVTARDYPVIQGGVLLIACIVIAVNFIVDLIYIFVDPKLRG